MNALTTAAPPALVLFAAAAVCGATGRRCGHAVAVFAGLATVAWLLAVPAGLHLQTSLFGFEVVLFRVDPFSRSVGLAFGYIAAAASLYAYATDADGRQTAYALAYVGSATGAIFAGDWLTLVIFWELMAVCATLLLWHGGGDARRAGFRYAIYHEVGGAVLIAAVLLQYARSGTFLYTDGLAGLPATLAAVGIGLNAGFLGLHVWTVDAYPRPHVAASVILAACTTKVGAYALVRAFPGGNGLLAYVGGAMVVGGVSMAILQTDTRRLLTYHIVSQVGYMVAGVGAGTGLAVAGAFAHLVNNVLYKSLLFMVAGAIVYRTGEGNLKRLGGLARPMPVTFGLFVVAAASIAGVPGTNGFVSKAMVVDGVEAAGMEPLWWLLMIGAVGTVISFLKFGYYAFLHGPSTTTTSDLSAGQAVSIGATAALCVALGLVLDPFFAALPGDPGTAKPFAPSQFSKAGGLLAAGAVAFGLLRGPLARIERVPDIDAVYHPLGLWFVYALVAGTAGVAGAVDRAAGRLWALAARLSAGSESTAGSDLDRRLLLVVLTLVFVLAVALL